MLYIYEVMKLVGYIIIKHVIKKHKEYSTTWYQHYLDRMKNNKAMRSQSYKVKIVYPPPPPKEKVLLEIFIISFESTQNKQHFNTKITCTEDTGGRGIFFK